MTNRIDTIRAVIADLRKCLNVLPAIDASSGRDLMDQHRAHRAAASRLGHYLTETYGATIADKQSHHRIRMCGITSTSTGGLAAAMANWIAAAERKIG